MTIINTYLHLSSYEHKGLMLKINLVKIPATLFMIGEVWGGVGGGGGGGGGMKMNESWRVDR